MNEDAPVTRSSLVPVLGAIALMLFSLNFYTFLDRHFSDDVRQFFCAREPLWIKHDHRHDRTARVEIHHEAWIQRDMERAERTMERAQRFMNRDFERADRELARAQRELERALRDLERAGLQNQGDISGKLHDALREVERARRIPDHSIDLDRDQLRDKLRELHHLHDRQDRSDVHDAESIVLHRGDRKIVIRTQ